MADSQAWQTQFGDQPWFDHSTSSHGIQPQPLQPEIDLITMPNGSGSGSDPQTQTGQGLHHGNYSLPQWQTLAHGSSHPGFNSEASMLAQPGSPNSGLSTPSLSQWQPVTAPFESSNSGLIPSSLSQLQAHHVPQPVQTQLGVSLNSGQIPPSLPQWQSVPPQFGGSDSGLNPPSLPQWQASVPQPVPAQYGGSNSGLPPSQPQWQAPPSFDSQHFHSHFSLSDTHSLDSPINSFQANVTENLGRVKRIRKSHKRDSQRFTVFGDTKRARPTGKCIASDTEPIMVSQDVIENLKNLAYKDMVLMVTTLYQFFVARLISEETDNLKRWKTTQEGQTFVSRLKGAVKNIHSEFQKAARIVVLASNQSLAELLMTNAADMQASQDARVGNLVENASSFDVPIQVPVENGGHVGSFQVPLAHPSVTALLEYVLVDKKYSDYLCVETGNWKTRFEHAFAFSAAICRRELQRLPHAGWVNAAANDFPINGVEVAYNRYMEYISTLVGDQKLIFDRMMSGMYRKA
ncbi:hypothetical protein BDR07DRAFT_1378919 [Suillus spraguei]|nr:hypothetical protein BDR07DRAFT_1378919 [Suillus spraguei]